MSEEILGFNVRVYAICVRKGLLLTLHEHYGKWDLIKLPGGGLEYGEGPVDCLKREFKEELNLDVSVGECFYIQRDYVKSIVDDHKQILVLYFEVSINNIEELKICDSHVASVNWLPIIENCPLTLPVDKIVYEKIKTIWL